jgi:hypothetical protein
LFSVARVIEHLRRGARTQRALEFAEKYFHGCTAHVHEAVAVHGELEFLSRCELAECNSSWNVRDILGEPSESLRRWFREAPETPDNSQVLVTLQLTPQMQITEMPDPALVARWTEVVFHRLLGPFAKRSTWTPETIWTRSIGGIINERVRRSEQCTCLPNAPSNNRLERTSD